MHKKHAEHNQSLCDHLIKTRGFNDWVVTTAFYSAHHFIQHKLFPLLVEEKEYKNFIQYYNKNQRNLGVSKHEGLILITEEFFPLISAEYRWLHDVCHTARYKDYNVNDFISVIARKRLQDIKNACLK